MHLLQLGDDREIPKQHRQIHQVYTNIVRQVDIYLQEDQLMCTQQGFPLVPAPSYLPNMYELGHSDVRQIDDRTSTKIRRVEDEMLVIMQEHQEREQQDVSHNSLHSSFS